MVLPTTVLARYESPQHIMEEFYAIRTEYYIRRKTALLNRMQSEWSKLDNKVCGWVGDRPDVAAVLRAVKNFVRCCVLALLNSPTSSLLWTGE